MKRTVRVGSLLFLLRLLACHSLERALRIRLQPMRIPASPLQARCGGYGHYRAELGFDSPSLTMPTGLSERRLSNLSPPSRLFNVLFSLSCFPLTPVLTLQVWC